MVFGEDIIIDILSRLPVRSLLRLKCVCKGWQQLIESDDFIRKHFDRETNRSCLLVQYIPRESRISHFALFPDKDLKDTPPAHEDLYKQLDIRQIFGPVNGLFFLHRDFRDSRCLGNPMAIWNPATRQLKRIIYPKPRIPSHCTLDAHQFGFGFDCSINDYKVIWFCGYFDVETERILSNIDVTIYSLSKDSWSLPVEMDCLPNDSLCNTFINGAYYWLCLNRSPTCLYSIISFDMASEVFRDIQGPDNLDPDSLGGNDLILYNDHLALLISDYCSFYHIWIMEEEGCWIKLLTVGAFPDWGSVTGIWKDNELLIRVSRKGQLLLYNIDSCENKDLGLECMRGSSYCYTYRYKESLVSVKGGTEDWVVFDLDWVASKRMATLQINERGV